MADWCLIVPYRDRAEHLAAFSEHMAKHLPGVPIYVIEQADDKPFNRGKLLNAGFREAGRDYEWVVYHDVDMLPVDVDYTGTPDPTCLATECSQFGYKRPYDDYFGGVTVVATQTFLGLDGYSNEFWGWGGEDDEFLQNIRSSVIWQPQWRRGRFECFDHARPVDSKLHAANIQRLKGERSRFDGLKRLRHQFVSKEVHDHYTLIKVAL